MQPVNWSRSPSNKVCLYCNEQFDGSTNVATKEHLIGRNFVPRGSLNGGRSFNFIFDACSECNNDKAALEGHVSAITQFLSQSIAENSAFADRAGKKSRGEIHPWTKKPVADSVHEWKIETPGMSFGFVGPPQPDRKMVRRLALRHVQGMFALVTNPDRTAKPLTLLYPGSVWVVGEYLRGDWGNTQAKAAHDRTRNWGVRAALTTASGFFRFILRRDAAEIGTWFWAVEWNDAMRVVGGISPDAKRPSFMEDLPELHWLQMATSNGGVFRTRREEPLDVDRDNMFSSPP
jgi:hypothetical protein